MLPASFAACVPVFIATATSACASAGASLVPSPHIATSRPFGLVLANELELRLGRGFGEELVDAGFGGDRRRRQPVVAGDHDGLDAHLAQLREALVDAALDDVAQLDHAEHARVRRRPPAASRPRARSWSTVASPLTVAGAALRLRRTRDRIGRALADAATVEVDAAHARLRGELGRCARP